MTVNTLLTLAGAIAWIWIGIMAVGLLACVVAVVWMFRQRR